MGTFIDKGWTTSLDGVPAPVCFLMGENLLQPWGQAAKPAKPARKGKKDSKRRGPKKGRRRK
jgi:hypothetical protein